jgi:hypothetical protein
VTIGGLAPLIIRPFSPLLSRDNRSSPEALRANVSARSCGRPIICPRPGDPSATRTAASAESSAPASRHGTERFTLIITSTTTGIGNVIATGVFTDGGTMNLFSGRRSVEMKPDFGHASAQVSGCR